MINLEAFGKPAAGVEEVYPQRLGAWSVASCREPPIIVRSIGFRRDRLRRIAATPKAAFSAASQKSGCGESTHHAVQSANLSWGR